MKNAGVAQLVEQLTCNQQVGGSNPFASSVTGLHTEMPIFRVPKFGWQKGAHASIWADAGVGEPGRTVNPLAYALEGSNPPPPTACSLFARRERRLAAASRYVLGLSENEESYREMRAALENRFVKLKTKRGSNSVGRVTAFQAVGRGFESRLPLSNGRLRAGEVLGRVGGLQV